MTERLHLDIIKKIPNKLNDKHLESQCTLSIIECLTATAAPDPLDKRNARYLQFLNAFHGKYKVINEKDF